jgi:ABC-type multidrug transport system ATPase subunit
VSGDGGVYADLTIGENLEFVARAYGLRGERLEASRREMLAATGLEGADDRLAGSLSGGMRQKLALALAMLHEPEFLILDEPTVGLDPVSRSDLWRLIVSAAAGGAAVVVSTSSLDEAERASSILLLESGRGSAERGAPSAASAAHGSAPAPASPLPHGHTASALANAAQVTRRFGDLVAVAAVDLAVQPGEIVGLLGANGAGKTTLIRLLLGLVRPDKGSVRLFGRPPSRTTRRRLGYVPQSLGLWEDLTVRENLAFSARSFGSVPPPLDADLDSLSDTVVRDLPLGMRRRLAFAASLAHTPELLVLDEPTSGVDPDASDRLWSTIRAATGAGAGALVTTHHLSEADKCDRVVVMAAGRVIAEGTVTAIIEGRMAVVVRIDDCWQTAYAALEDTGLRPSLAGATLRLPSSDVEGVRHVLEAAGVAAGVRLEQATLEEAFIELTGGAPAS